MKSLTCDKIIDSNGWLSGWYDYRDGDLMAIVNQPEKFEKVTEVNDLQELYRLLRNFDGAFKYRNLLFFRDWQYGTFVYDINKPESYIEHLSIDAISLDRFKEIINDLVIQNDEKAC